MFVIKDELCSNVYVIPFDKVEHIIFDKTDSNKAERIEIITKIWSIRRLLTDDLRKQYNNYISHLRNKEKKC